MRPIVLIRAALAPAGLAALASLGIPANASTSFAVTASSRTAAAAAPSLHWIISKPAENALLANGLRASQAKDLFGNSKTYLTWGSNPSGWASLPTASFTDYRALKRAVTGHRLPRGTKAVLFDDEHWQFTPRYQQRHPGRYERLAAAVAHRAHLKFIATPSPDLAWVLMSHPRDRMAAYLKLHLARSAARYADAIDIQGQYWEMHRSRFASFVQAAARQARSANRHVVVLAGISTDPSGQKVPAWKLIRAVRTTMKYVSGYWLNIPKGTKYCPECRFRPGVAVRMLRWLMKH